MARVIQVDGHLRELLRTARRQAHLTQEDAAKRAGVTQGWWKQIENSQANVKEDTLVAMLAVAGVQPDRLTQDGYKDLAALVSTRLDLDRDSRVSLEDYLAAAPASEALREALISLARGWNHTQPKKGRRQREPFAVQFMPPARQGRQNHRA